MRGGILESPSSNAGGGEPLGSSPSALSRSPEMGPTGEPEPRMIASMPSISESSCGGSDETTSGTTASLKGTSSDPSGTSASNAGMPDATVAGIPETKETDSVKIGTQCSTRVAVTHLEVSQQTSKEFPGGTSVGTWDGPQKNENPFSTSLPRLRT